MPSVSERQHNAMEAAAHGHSTLGIPKKVGEEFARADDATKPIAAGVIFVAPDGDVLLLRRAKDEKNYGGHWGLPGGGGNEGETAEDTARRETKEETAFDIDMASVLKLVDRVETPNGMLFSTYALPVDKKFVPSLDDGEHIGYCWSALDQLPRPIHPQVERVLGEHLGATADMSPEDWEGLRSGFVKWTREEEAEPEHADDRRGVASDAQLAFDENSFRTYDQDGRLRIGKLHVSMEQIAPYWGHEIPDAEKFGWDPDKQYKLYRPAEELEKAAQTLNGVPVVFGHIPISADDHPSDRVIGAMGTEAEFAAPYLNNSMIIWRRDGIDAVEDGSQRAISPGYRYRLDPTPGRFKGEDFDGIMRDIAFQHVATVEEGRSGPTVIVPDHQIIEKEWLIIEDALLALSSAS